MTRIRLQAKPMMRYNPLLGARVAAVQPVACPARLHLPFLSLTPRQKGHMSKRMEVQPCWGVSPDDILWGLKVAKC